MKTIIAILGLLILAPATGARADHLLLAGPVACLQRDTRGLAQAIRYVPISRTVMDVVFRFGEDVERLVHCVDYNRRFDRDDQVDHGEMRFDHRRPGHRPQPYPQPRGRLCEIELHRVHSAFYSIDRYLRDTRFDFPQVYQQYLRVHFAMRALPR